jgi:NSS family neurotransmitter:Na+ symporter
VVSLDTLVAILAGLIIFPGAFSVNIQPDMGPSLIFVTLPNVFQQAFGSMPVLSWVFSVMFYLLLSVAALTSTISLHEVVTAYLKEEFKISRKKAAWIVTIFCLGLGVIASLSLGAWSGASLFGMSFFDFSDYITTKIMMPIGGMLISIFVGWYMDRKDLRDEMMSSGELKNSFFKVFAFILKYIVPLGIAILFINGMGWI